MANIKPTWSEVDYKAALDRFSELLDTETDSPEGDEFNVPVDLVELYESKHVPMGYPNPITANEFCMEQAGLRPADLASFIGSRSKVSEVLSGMRSIIMPTARPLHGHLGISAASTLVAELQAHFCCGAAGESVDEGRSIRRAVAFPPG